MISLDTITSAQLASLVTDETGSGALVFASSPTLVAPALGTPTALVGTNITGTGANFTAGTATQLLNTRSIALGGEASGTTNFDGSTNVTITTTIPLLDGGNY